MDTTYGIFAQLTAELWLGAHGVVAEDIARAWEEQDAAAHR